MHSDLSARLDPNGQPTLVWASLRDVMASGGVPSTTGVAARVLVVVACAAAAAALLGTVPDRSGAQRQAQACPVTVVGPRTRPPASVPRSFNYGNASVAVALYPPDGHLVAGRLPGGGRRATIDADGSIGAKYGWWRDGDDARLKISGHRLDAAAKPLIADVPNGYGIGFQATGLTFPTTGCWRVTGTFKSARLSFIVRVTKSPLGP